MKATLGSRKIRNSSFRALAAAVFLAAGATAALRAADETPAAANQEKRAELRERLRNMTPAERQAARDQFRKRQQKAAEQARKLTSEERKAIQAKRRKAIEERPGQTPEQREAVAKERRAKLQQRLEELRKKNEAGTLSQQEKRQLEHLEQRLKEAGTGSPGPKKRDQQAPRAPGESGS